MINEKKTSKIESKTSGFLQWGYSLNPEINNCLDTEQIVQKENTEIVRGLVSIIMPVYNTDEEYLIAAIKSVQNQTYQQIELLIIDDGSDKNYAILCDCLADERTRVIHIENSGVSAARNIGIEESKGEYVAFIDSDDTMAVNFIALMVEQIQYADFVVCGCNHVQEIEEPSRREIKDSKIIAQKECVEYLCYMNPPFQHIETNAIWGKLYRKELIEDLRFDEELVIAEDFVFNFRYIQRCENGEYLDFRGYNYLVHDSSISRKYNPRMINTIAKLENLISDNETTSEYDPLISRCVNIAFTILMMIPKGYMDEKRQIEGFINRYRSRVLGNPKTKRKVKIAITSSYLGYWTTRMIFEMNRR